jgi:hypothetical protein
MTTRILVAAVLASLLAGCGGPVVYRVKVNNQMTPFKAADPDDLVVEDEAADDEDADKPGAGEE